MITLFHRAKTRSTRFLFLLEELGVPYEITRVTTLTRGGEGSVDPRNPHPHGKVPAISDDGVIVFESPAIAVYLTDKFPEKELGPAVGDPRRGAYLSWLSYYAGVLEPAFVSKFLKVEVPVGTAGWVDATLAVEAVCNQLAQGPYLLGEEFSAVDVLYATTFAMFAGSPLLPPNELLSAYVARCLARPAYARGMEKDEG